MNVDLVVYNSNEDRELSFGKYAFAHADCGRMNETHHQAADEYVLRCSCGLEIHFPRLGSAVGAIMDTAIDKQPRNLASDSFHSNFAKTIRVCSRDAA